MGVSQIALLSALMVVTGAIGAITGGNSLINVPLMIMVGMSPRQAVATNMFAVTFMTISATARFARAGMLKRRLLIPLGALDAQAALDAQVLLPIHWATFNLGFHAWSEPAETLVREAALRGASIVTPRLGEPVELAISPGPTPWSATTAWWRALPPIAATCP